MHANCGEDMAIAPAFRKMVGTYAQTGEILARFVAGAIIYRLY
jgi:hypothetical protein